MPEKNIRDYLPFYLGCECEMKRDDYLFPHPVLLSPLLLTEYLQTYCLVGGIELKPILRPLSDMTQEEADVMDIIDESDIETPYCLYIKYANATKYLLSKHFDLFGLIEAGLAIDKTTINNQILQS